MDKPFEECSSFTSEGWNISNVDSFNDMFGQTSKQVFDLHLKHSPIPQIPPHKEKEISKAKKFLSIVDNFLCSDYFLYSLQRFILSLSAIYILSSIWLWGKG